MNMHGGRIVARDYIRSLAFDAHAHVLQHRQRTRERHRFTDLIQPKTQRAACTFTRLRIKRHRNRRLRRYRAHGDEIRNCLFGAGVFGISDRERQHELATSVVGGVFARRLDEALEHTFFPASDGGDHFRFERLEIGHGFGGGRGAHQHVDTREHRFG